MAQPRPAAGSFSAYPSPTSIILYTPGQGYVKFDQAKAAAYFRAVVDKMTSLAQDTIAAWDKAGCSLQPGENQVTMAEQKIDRPLGFNTRALHAGYSPTRQLTPALSRSTRRHHSCSTIQITPPRSSACSNSATSIPES